MSFPIQKVTGHSMLLSCFTQAVDLRLLKVKLENTLPLVTLYTHLIFFKRHGITKSNRFGTWTTYRTQIEQELVEIIGLMKVDPKVDPTNLYAVGFSNGGYWQASWGLNSM